MTLASRGLPADPGHASVRDVREATKRGDKEFILNRYYGTVVSPYFTVLCLRLGLSADLVTILGGAIGALGAALLFPVLGPWTVVGAVALQVSYILDFSDGQVARMRGTTSMAGGYLDWLTHLFVPPAAALATAASVSVSLGQPWPFAFGIVAALGLAPLAFQGKEHVLISMARTAPQLGRRAFYFAALADDARPADVEGAPAGEPAPLASGAVAGRLRKQSIYSLVGEMLIYPGAAHLLTLASLLDFASFALGGPSVVARGAVLLGWAGAFCLRFPIVVTRNYRIIRAVERRKASEQGQS